MDEVTLSRFLASALNVPMAIPIVLFLIPRWRIPQGWMNVAAVGLEVLIGLFTWFVYCGMGLTLAATWLVGLVLPLVCVMIFVIFSDYRDGRVVFVMATAGLNIAMCDALTDIFSQRSEPLWLMIKVLIVLVQGVLVWRFCRKPLGEMLDANSISWGWIAVIPLMLTATLSYYHVTLEPQQHNQFSALPPILLCASAVLIYITLYRFQRAIMEQAEIRQDAMRLRSEIDFLHRQTTAAESASISMRIFHHDIRHYLSLLRAGVSSGDGEAATALLDSMEENLNLHSSRPPLRGYTGDALLDSVLTQGGDRAEEAGVAFTAQFTLPDALLPDRAELAVVVSNALENALNAVLKEPEDRPRQVEVKGIPHGEHFLLVVSNTFTGTLTLDPKTGLPRTEEPGHGYGTHSMARFAQKYGGLAGCSVTEGVFSLRIYV